MKISVVVPAQNEGRYIERCLRSVHENLRDRWDYEIILVDNASSDNTAELAAANGVQVLSIPNKSTPSAVRNLGVRAAAGDVLLFIDGDVYLADDWHARAQLLVPKVLEQDLITGSTYDVDPEASWVAKDWFGPLFERQDRFVNAGHMLLSRDLFDRLGGFDEGLETGEDTEFCERALARGAAVVCDKQLVSVHLGYPNDLGHFFRRERWHGKGNFITWQRFTSSKIPFLVLFNLLSFVAALVLPWLTGDWRWLLWYPAVALGLGFVGALKWLHGFGPNFLGCMFLSWWYLTARVFSLFDVLRERWTR